MLTNKDIRVENGNLVLNGDKFPLDGQSPETIMEIVEDNSDSTPTAESANPVTSAGIKTYVDTAIGGVNDLLLPISGVVKRFKINGTNQTINTGINFNLETTKGFIALISSYGSLNAGRMNVYVGGVPHNKEGGTIGDLKVERLGGIALGGESAVSDNATFSIVDDTLRITSPANQGGLRITLILTTSE